MSSRVNLSTLPLPSKKPFGASQSVEALLVKYGPDFGLSKKQIDTLLNLQRDGEYILSSSNINFVYELISMIKAIGYDETLIYLQNLESGKRLTAKSILDSVMFEREETLYQAETSRIRDLFQVKVSGANKCNKCGGYNTLSTISGGQRSSDEALNYDILCQDCGNTFRR